MWSPQPKRVILCVNKRSGRPQGPAQIVNCDLKNFKNFITEEEGLQLSTLKTNDYSFADFKNINMLKNLNSPKSNAEKHCETYEKSTLRGMEENPRLLKMMNGYTGQYHKNIGKRVHSPIQVKIPIVEQIQNKI